MVLRFLCIKPTSAYAVDYTKTDPSRSASLSGYVNFADGYTAYNSNPVHGDRGDLTWSDDLWLSGINLTLDDGGYGGGIEYSLHTHNYAWTRTAHSGTYLNSQLENGGKTYGSHAWVEAVTCQLYNGVSNYYYLEYYGKSARCTWDYLYMWSANKTSSLYDQWQQGNSKHNVVQYPGQIRYDAGADMTDWNGQNWVGTTGMGMPMTGFSCGLRRRTGTLEVNPAGGTWNGSTSSTKLTYYADGSFTINNPTRSGYTFTGWTLTFTDAGGADESNNYQAPASSDYPHVGATIYNASQGTGVFVGKDLNSSKALYVGNMKNIALSANWTENIKTCTLTINPNGGSYDGKTTNSTKTMTYDSSNNNGIGTPTRTGYTFKGWYTSASGGTPVWDTNGYAIQYNKSTSYWKGGDKWSDSWMGGSYTDWYDMKWNRTSDLTVYAHWKAINYTMTMNHYKQVWNTETSKWEWKQFDTKTASAAYDSTFTPPYITAPTGYKASSRDSDSGWKVTGDKTFNLYYAPLSYDQTINYYKHQSSGGYSGPTYNDTLLGSKSWSQKYSSVFDAYGKRASWGNVAGYHWWKISKNSWIVTGAGSTNSYYYPNKYRLNVDLNKGSGSTTPSGTSGNFDMEYGTYINLGSPTRTGYTFAGWKIVENNSTGSSLSGNKFTMGYNKSYPHANYVDNATVKIQAQWTANVYNITYHGNGGVRYDNGAESYGNTATFDATYHVDRNYFSRDDYWFLGWSTEPDGPVSSTWIPNTDIIMKTSGHVDLYAVWERVRWTASGTKINGDTVFGVNTSVAGYVTDLSGLCSNIKSAFGLTSNVSINPWDTGMDRATPLNYIQYGDMYLYLYANIENGVFTKVTYEFDTATGISTVVKNITASTDTLSVQLPPTLTYDQVYSVKVTIENPGEYAKTSQRVYFTYTEMNMEDILSRIRKQ